MGDLDLNLTTCDREPIHLQPAVQEVGFLVAFRPDNLKIQVVSENISEFLGLPFQSAIGKNLGEILPSDWVQKHSMEFKAADRNLEPGYVERLRLADGVVLNCYFYFTEGHGVLEFEPIGQELERGLLEERLNEILDGIKNANHMVLAAQALAAGVRRLTDLDRVMVYQFLKPSWNGEVIAESRIASVHSFQGHRFPAADIPKPARDLYLRNQVRFIYDAKSPGSPLYFGPQTKPGQKMDLQDSRLRAVAPVHLTYLHNMGVTSSFSIAIIVDGVLWGLLTCHHLSPLKIDSRLRTACELLCKTFAMRVQAEEKMWNQQMALNFERGLRSLIADLRHQRDLWTGFFSAHSTFLQLFQARGAALISGDSADLIGITPPVSELKKMASLVDQELSVTQQNWFSTSSLMTLSPLWEIFKTEASGLLAIRISEISGGYLMIFRSEMIETIEWGGDPRKILDQRDYQGQINPRKSFETWSEKIFGRSLEWRDFEVEGLCFLKEIVFDTLLVKDQLIRELNEKLTQKGF